MRVALLVNPIAGRGRAGALVADFASELRSAGFDVVRIEQQQPGDGKELTLFDAAVLMGGDGTLNRWLPRLAEGRTPVWHVPLGTENLFARSFGHGMAPEAFIRAARRMSHVSMDLGRCGGRLFSIMASIGPDADVVRTVSERRRGAITRLNYARPIASQLLKGRKTSGRVTCDGRTVLDGPIGLLVAANLPAYATRLNPAWHAVPHDGLVSLVHLPGRGAFSVGLRLLAGLARDPELVPGRLATESSRIEIEIDDVLRPPPAVQIDGDLLGPSAWEGHRLVIEIVPDALRVLAPSP